MPSCVRCGGRAAPDEAFGAAAFAVGDRLQLTGTNKKRRIYNGNVGTITGLDVRHGQLTTRMDAAVKAGRALTFATHEFEEFRHDYAGTIYKGRGKTLDRTHPYRVEHWRSAPPSRRLSQATSQNPDSGIYIRDMGRSSW